jgi:hypothetical protein
MCLRRVMVVVLAALIACHWVSGSVSQAQAVPTGDQLTQLVAPIALYPDTLLAQICAASTDPQQIIDANNWVKQNQGLQGQALQDAALKGGFDPAFVSLVTFPQVLDMMATHIDDYAALGAAFKANQQTVMSAIQTLRQQAYASGALDSNEYQTVSVQQDGNTKVVVVQPANPQVVYVPQYQPQQVYVASSGPSTGDIVAASLISFGAGIAIGALINNNQPYGWGGWGWGWGGRGVIVHNNVWVVNNHYHSPYPPYRPRPPVYGRPIYARPPNNWNNRPGYRPPPPGYRPDGPNKPGYRPPPNNGGGRPPNPGNGGRPPGNGNGGGNRPGNGSGTRPPGNGNGGGTRPPGNGGGTRPPGNGGTPGNGGGTRPPGNGGNPGTRPPGNGGGGRPPVTARPTPTTRPAPTPANRPAPRPAPGGSYSGHPQGGAKPAQRPQPQTGSRPSGFGGNNNGAAARQASNRGKASAGGGGRPGGKPK